MADGGSALESQQAIGAKIPYENIAANQRGIEMAMGAFYHAAEISRKRQQLEQALQIASLKNEEQERWHNMQMQNYEAQTAVRIMGVENAAARIQQNAELQARGMAVREETLDLKKLKDEEQINQTSNLLSGMSTMKAKPGDPDYYSQLTDLASKNARAAGSPLGRQILKDHKEDHNLAVRRAWDANNAAWKALSYNVKREIWGGKSEDLAPLINPEMWKPQVDAQGKPTGKVFMPLGPKIDPKTGLPGDEMAYTTIPSQRLVNLKKQYDDLSKQRTSIPSQINDDDVRAVQAGSSFKPLPRTKEELVAGDGYTTPKGPKRWTGTGFVDP